jgi:hypothetical protein
LQTNILLVINIINAIDFLGTLNPKTAYMMSIPRCGVRDTSKFDREEEKQRRKRYVLQGLLFIIFY